jgi:hypothetical protein
MLFNITLGTHATSDVMEAWVNLFAFVMKSMLPPAIKGQVVETELNINTSSEFENGKIAAEVSAVEDEKAIRMNLGKHSKHSGSDTYSDTPSGTSAAGNNISLELWATAHPHRSQSDSKSSNERIHPM